MRNGQSDLPLINKYSLVTKIFAAEFSVVSFEGECELSVGGNTYPMTQFDGLPLYRASVDVQIGTP
ncbi:hypothetical protein BCR32DRAFT_288421 [Anaeromyces robustus]|uniref:Uncharacterized protein n=1 Tax=Anaeromyces robustus TaxID=1754192 RepID=A0A1Y1UXV4_9FUNG|nr:hypothetical protein BCR32DRAFT_288421 [Anaeromyces robustus]|eukprot:ORX42077.1 hypothetical protein BCR32DRAFT_288421 [Anaeromyces robustus]